MTSTAYNNISYNRFVKERQNWKRKINRNMFRKSKLSKGRESNQVSLGLGGYTYSMYVVR